MKICFLFIWTQTDKTNSNQQILTILNLSQIRKLIELTVMDKSFFEQDFAPSYAKPILYRSCKVVWQLARPQSSKINRVVHPDKLLEKIELDCKNEANSYCIAHLVPKVVSKFRWYVTKNVGLHQEPRVRSEDLFLSKNTHLRKNACFFRKFQAILVRKTLCSGSHLSLSPLPLNVNQRSREEITGMVGES